MNKVLSTRLIRPHKDYLHKMHNEMHLMINRPGWNGDWYAWEHELKTNNNTGNIYRLDYLISRSHEINSIQRFDGTIFKIGDVIKHNETEDYNRSIIKSFSRIPNQKNKYKVTFDLKGGGFLTCNLSQIEIWDPIESCRYEILDTRDFVSDVPERVNKKLLLL